MITSQNVKDRTYGELKNERELLIMRLIAVNNELQIRIMNKCIRDHALLLHKAKNYALRHAHA